MNRLLAAAMLLLLTTLGSCVPALASDAATRREIVFLVHGLGRSRLSMLPMEHVLEREGYTVVNWGYSSVSSRIPELAASLAEEVRETERRYPGYRIHFVGHSLGGILIRFVLVESRPERMGRVVMLAPPNQGSRMADRFARWAGWLLRPLPELRTTAGSTVRTLPAAPDVEVGVIAGLHDRKVRLEEARLPGTRDFVTVPAGHTFLMARGDVQRLTLRFLRTGRFAEAHGMRSRGTGQELLVGSSPRLRFQ